MKKSRKAGYSIGLRDATTERHSVTIRRRLGASCVNIVSQGDVLHITNDDSSLCVNWGFITERSVPARLGKGQGAKEIGHNPARERPKFGHNLVRKRHKIGHTFTHERPKFGLVRD